jgi:hypothetical protein
MSTHERQTVLFPQLEPINQEDAVAALSPDYQVLWDTLMCPWHDFQQRRSTDHMFREMDTWDAAQWLTMQARIHAQDAFHDHEYIRPRRLKSGMFILEYRESFAIVVKKLTVRRVPGRPPELCRSNNLNRSNKDYWDQRKRDDFPDMSRIILGYLLERELTTIKIYIAYPRTRCLGLLWYYRMPIQAQTGLRIATTTESTDQQPVNGFEVIPNMEVNESGDQP